MNSCRTRLTVVAVMLSLSTQIAGAQNPQTALTTRMYSPVRDNIIASADLMPDASFAFQPVPTVRTFGQLIGHIANAEFTICSAALGRPNPHPDDVEKRAYAPADLRRVVREAFRLCDEAFAQLRDASLNEQMDFFGGKEPRHYAMTYSIIHANEHYGNMVTYMRMKGLVPPSSAAR